MIEEVIRNFPDQFAFRPVIENESAFRRRKRMIVCGMGGSNLATTLVQMAHPREDIRAHRDYGLPLLPNGDLEASFVVASSYSGGTEETLSSFEMAVQRGVMSAAVGTGGRLLELAEKKGVPYIRIPRTARQPRFALGFQTRSLLALWGDEKGLEETGQLQKTLDGARAEKQGKALARKLAKKIPVIYASGRNKALAYIWKVKFNETAKIPAFCDVFPELNHNEMIGFDTRFADAAVPRPFRFVFLRDDEDPSRIGRRMDETAKLLKRHRYGVDMVQLEGGRGWQKIFSNLLIADWASLALAHRYGADPEEIPMIEEFKRRIA